MTERFTIKPQDDLFGVVDNYSPDKICVVNGIRTEIEAKWLCDLMNELNNENINIKNTIKEAYNNERTHIGRNVLKQLLNNIGETNE